MKARMCCVLSHVQLFATPWTGARQAPLSMGFSRQEYWSGLSFPPLGDLPNPGVEPISLAYPAMVGRSFTTVPPGKPIHPSGLPLNLTPERFSDLPPKQIFSNLLISPCTQFTSVSQLHHKLWVHVPWFPVIEYLLVHASLCLPDSTISSGCVCHGFRVPYRICGDQAVPGTYTCLINI